MNGKWSLRMAALGASLLLAGCASQPARRPEILSSYAPAGSPQAPPLNSRTPIAVPSAPVRRGTAVVPVVPVQPAPATVAVPAQPCPVPGAQLQPPLPQGAAVPQGSPAQPLPSQPLQPYAPQTGQQFVPPEPPLTDRYGR